MKHYIFWIRIFFLFWNKLLKYSKFVIFCHTKCDGFLPQLLYRDLYTLKKKQKKKQAYPIDTKTTRKHHISPCLKTFPFFNLFTEKWQRDRFKNESISYPPPSQNPTLALSDGLEIHAKFILLFSLLESFCM